jgi:hypothetical protein
VIVGVLYLGTTVILAMAYIILITVDYHLYKTVQQDWLVSYTRIRRNARCLLMTPFWPVLLVMSLAKYINEIRIFCREAL